MFCSFEFIPLFPALFYNIDKSNKEEINMYKPNNRKELKAMHSFLPLNAFGADRKSEKNGIESKTLDHVVVWLDELRSDPMLPVDNTFLVCLYRQI